MLVVKQFIPFITLALSPLVQGYVPTAASASAPSGPNVGSALLIVRRAPNASFTTSDVVRVQAGVTAPHPFSGALVQYDQAFFKQPVFTSSVTTPWVAYVPCDRNVTDAPNDVLNDIDNLRGATSVILYSLTSESCTLNPSDFGKELDIYVTTKATTAKLISAQFSGLADVKFGTFDSDLLNQNAASVQASLANVGGAITTPFLMATFQVPGSGGGTTAGSTAGGSSTSGSTNPTSTGGTSAGGYSYAPGTATGTSKPVSTPGSAAVGSTTSVVGVALSLVVFVFATLT